MPVLFVRRLEAHAPLPIERRRQIEALTSRLDHLGPYEEITRHGEEPRAVSVMLSGWACRHKVLRDGRRQITALFLPGDLCGSYVFRPDAMKQSLTTLTPAIVAKLPASAVRELAASYPDFSEALWWQMLLAIEIQREWTVSIGRRSAEERLAHLICEVWMRLDIVGLTEGPGCEMPMTQHDIADALGLSTVHVNRCLRELREKGLLDLYGKWLFIPNRQKLAAFAMFDPTYLHRRSA